MNVLRYVLEGKPVPWQRASKAGKRHFTAPKMREAQDAHRWKALQVRPFSWSQEGVFEIEVVAYRTALSRGDSDNYGKLVKDALQGIAYRNDHQVKRDLFTKETDRERPRTEVTVRRIA